MGVGIWSPILQNRNSLIDILISASYGLERSYQSPGKWKLLAASELSCGEAQLLHNLLDRELEIGQGILWLQVSVKVSYIPSASPVGLSIDHWLPAF